MDRSRYLSRRSSAARISAVETLEPRIFLSTTNSFVVSQTSGEKPQAKLWHESGYWFAVMPDASGTWVRRLDGSSWTSVLKLSSSTTAKADVRDLGGVAHVLLFDGNSNTKLASIELVSGTKPGYRLWSERSSLTSVPLASGVETATIDIDSEGRLWVAYDNSNSIYVRYSDGKYSSFSSAITLATGITDDDIAAITRVGDDDIGVFWSNQNTRKFGFRLHDDDDSAGNWGSTETPGGSGFDIGDGFADDHISIHSTDNGELFAAVKTSYDTAGQPVLGLLKRSSSGTWSSLYTIDTKGTRPVLAIDDNANKIMVAYTDSTTTAASIVYRQSSTGNISFGSKKTLISGSWNSPSTTKDDIKGQFAFLATNASGTLAKAGITGSPSSGFFTKSKTVSSATFSSQPITSKVLITSL